MITLVKLTFIEVTLMVLSLFSSSLEIQYELGEISIRRVLNSKGEGVDEFYIPLTLSNNF